MIARVVCFAILLLAGVALGQGTYQRTQDNKTLVWNAEPKPGDSATWDGGRDDDGYAGGFGTLTWSSANGTTYARFYGNMVHGKFDGPVNAHANGKTAYAIFIDGKRTSRWRMGRAPSQQIIAQHVEKARERVAKKETVEPSPAAEVPKERPTPAPPAIAMAEATPTPSEPPTIPKVEPTSPSPVAKVTPTRSPTIVKAESTKPPTVTQATPSEPAAITKVEPTKAPTVEKATPTKPPTVTKTEVVKAATIAKATTTKPPTVTKTEPTKTPAVAQATPSKPPTVTKLEPTKTPAVGMMTPSEPPKVAKQEPIRTPAVAQAMPTKPPTLAKVEPATPTIEKTTASEPPAFAKVEPRKVPTSEKATASEPKAPADGPPQKATPNLSVGPGDSKAQIAANKPRKVGVDESLGLLARPPSSLRTHSADESSSEGPAQLTKANAVAIADAQARISGYDLADYDRPKTDFNGSIGNWSLVYERKSSRVKSETPERFRVSIDDKTKKTIIVPSR